MANEKRLIDVNKISYHKSGFPKGNGYDGGLDWAFREDIDKIPTVDGVEVVLCKEYIHQHTLDCPMNYEVETYDEDDGYESYMACNATNPEGFCMCGERGTNEEYVG